MTADILRQKVRKDFDTEQEGIARHDAVSAALARHEGKKITRRMDRDLEKINAHLTFRYGMIYAVFPKHGTHETHDHLLAYDSDPVFTQAGFERTDSCHAEPARVRNAERQQWLSTNDAEACAQAVAEFEQAILKLKEVPGGPAAYAVRADLQAKLEHHLGWRCR